ncbi:MAG: dihydrolipoyl dehydrogenase [Parachlamydiales bacterium]|nr:dihydrolipoyl dehydrogenase [Parachlamydiales bacterium]
MSEQKRQFDLAIIGAGPGGYVAAIRAAHSGKSVALIEDKELGGICLNWGCIPTKTLLAGADVLRKVKMAKEFGVNVDHFHVDFPAMLRRKTQVVERIRKSLEGLLLSHKIHILRGFGQFRSKNEIIIKGDETYAIQAEKTIIATGSRPRNLSAFPFDYHKIHDSSSIMELATLPNKMVIVGGGVIGCEFASLFKELGVDVVVLEALPMILSLEGKNVSDAMTSSFKKRGIAVHTNVAVKSIDTHGDGVVVHMGDDLAPISADIALVAVGRQFNNENIGLEKIGVAMHPAGFIDVDDHLQTNVPGIYAIGDITGKMLLAHLASHQGIIAAQNAIGIDSVIHYNAVPSVIFTHPEVGTVGLTLEKAQEKGYDATIGKFPFQALGKSQASMETEGFAQVVVEKRSGQILGAQVVGHEAATLIAEMAVAIQNELTLDCITETIHAHPTVSEAWLEASLIASDTPIHFPPKIRRS